MKILNFTKSKQTYCFLPASMPLAKAFVNWPGHCLSQPEEYPNLFPLKYTIFTTKVKLGAVTLEKKSTRHSPRCLADTATRE